MKTLIEFRCKIKLAYQTVKFEIIYQGKAFRILQTTVLKSDCGETR